MPKYVPAGMHAAQEPLRRVTQENLIDRGKLQIDVSSTIGFLPVTDAKIEITLRGPDGENQRVIETLDTDISGQTQTIDLPAPAFEYSQEPGDVQPYSEYDILVTAPGYESVFIEGTQILPDVTAVQPVQMVPEEVERAPEEDIIIPEHTLFGDYPPKIEEDEIKRSEDTGEIILSRVVIPETIVVHDGLPNENAPNYYVPYKDYIKNVASSEIYATWPESTIYANILAIMSFTLNRVYTEWYRNKGYGFTITSSTAYDHKWVYGKATFESIDAVVDRLYTSYLSRPNVRQPILTQYCDGKRVTCPNWMSQWGSKYLADQDYTALQILKNYYGDTIYINNAQVVSGVPLSWPGTPLEIGSLGEAVRTIQEQLNRISQNYPAIPKVAVDGNYGPRTEEAVRTFQKIFKLPQSGIVDYRTWYKISEIFVGVTRIAELV